MVWVNMIFDTIIHSFVKMWFFPYWVIGNVDPDALIKSCTTLTK